MANPLPCGILLVFFLLSARNGTILGIELPEEDSVQAVLKEVMCGLPQDATDIAKLERFILEYVQHQESHVAIS